MTYAYHNLSIWGQYKSSCEIYFDIKSKIDIDEHQKSIFHQSKTGHQIGKINLTL